MSESCEYESKNFLGLRKTLMCHFGCCEHDCCTKEEQITNSRMASERIGWYVGLPVGLILVVVILVTICLCCFRHQQRKQRSALPQSLFETGRHRPTIIIHMEPGVGQSQPPGDEHPVAQGPPVFEEHTKAPPLFEEAKRLSHGPGIMGRGNSGYRRFENE